MFTHGETAWLLATHVAFLIPVGYLAWKRAWATMLYAVMATFASVTYHVECHTALTDHSKCMAWSQVDAGFAATVGTIAALECFYSKPHVRMYWTTVLCPLGFTLILLGFPWVGLVGVNAFLTLAFIIYANKGRVPWINLLVTLVLGGFTCVCYKLATDYKYPWWHGAWHLGVGAMGTSTLFIALRKRTTTGFTEYSLIPSAMPS